MVIEYDGLMSQFADQQVLFLNLLFERQRSFKLLLCRLDICRCFSSSILDVLELLLEILNLRLRVFYELA